LSSQALAQEVACYLGLDLGGIKIKRFADGEIYVQVLVRTRGVLVRNRRTCCAGLQNTTALLRSSMPLSCHRLQESIRGCDVFLIQPTCPPVNDHLMELMVMIDACKRASARSITAVSSFHALQACWQRRHQRVPCSFLSSKYALGRMSKS
jgi:ribose-phosphate pyrophosphokinase